MNTRTLQSMFVAIPALLLGVPASAGDATRFAIEEDQVMIGFTASLGAHNQMVGVARTLGGTVQAAPAGTQIKLKLPVASLETSSVVSGAALRAAIDAEQFPEIELDATAPYAKGNDELLTFSGTLKLHGTAVPFSAPVKVLRDGRLAFVHATFPISLDAFGIAHPSIAGAAVGDRVDISVDARLHTLPEGQAVASF